MTRSAVTAPSAVELTRRPAVPNGVLGMLIFVATEIMFFAGLVSAHTIARTAAPMWPPPGQPRLPVESTAFNTAALLLSALFLYWAGREMKRESARARRPLAVALGLGAFFVFAQGVEWSALIGEGLTLTSSNHGGFFYLIVGAHALHAVAAIGLLGWALARCFRGTLSRAQLTTTSIFWYFVVGVWPALYLQVYL